MTQTTRIQRLACSAMLALLGACQAANQGKAPDRPDPEGSAGTSSSSGAGGGGSGSGAAATGTTGATTQEGARERCAVSQIGPPMLRRLTQGEFQRTVADIFPQITTGWTGVKVGTDAVSALGFSNDAATLVVSQQTAQEILSTAEDVATRVVADDVLPSILPCASSADAACAATFISQYGTRLFRRPLSADESQTYNDYFASVTARSSFKLGIKWTLVALFQSPNAVYRSEVGVANGASYTLTPNELATELAYTFGGSTPSPDLLAKAAAGALATPEARLAEARNLMTTPSGKEAVRELFREWSGYSLVKARNKTNTAFTPAIAADMATETERFIEDVLFAKGGSLKDLLTAPYTFVSPSLVTFYGYGASSADFTRVDRPANWGVGLLAQGSMLAANAHADATSPTWRGLLVFSKLFCNSKPKPPPVVPSIPAASPGVVTTRQRYEQSHISGGPACPACHTLWDPIGFGFEHFDEVGRYREQESGLPIDATGYVKSMKGEQIMTFDGAQDLATQLAGDADVTDCVSGLMSEYVYAGGGGVSCLAETARDGLASGKFGLVEYLAQLSTERQFSERSLTR